MGCGCGAEGEAVKTTPNPLPTPRTDAQICRVTIESEDSCSAIYVKKDGRDYSGDLVDADFTRQLELEITTLQSALESERDKLRTDLANLRKVANALAEVLKEQLYDGANFNRPMRIALAAYNSLTKKDNP
jgi:hypothetical protein